MASLVATSTASCKRIARLHFDLSRAPGKDRRAEGCRMTDMREIVVERDMMVPARDVVLLATDVHRPAGPRPYPVLLERLRTSRR